jgi:hypothetical protein
MWEFRFDRLERMDEKRYLKRTHCGPGVLRFVAAATDPDYPASWLGVGFDLVLNEQWHVFGTQWAPGGMFVRHKPTDSPRFRFNLLLAAGDRLELCCQLLYRVGARSPLLQLLEPDEVEPCPLCADPSNMLTLLEKAGKQDWWHG